MKMSRRALRMQRNHKRNSGRSSLNLTALMDIFTILVFFLMVNQSEVEVANNDSVDLPVSIVENKPEDQLTVMVTRNEILVQGRSILAIADLESLEDKLIPALQTELRYQAGRRPVTDGEPDSGRPITIVGDKNTPYSVLKKVMNTCAESGFNDVSLAVNHRQAAGGA